MTRRRTGTVEWRNGMWKARVTMPDGTRPWIDMPGIPQTDEAQARLVATVMAKRATETGSVPTDRDVTVTEYSEKWSDAREAEGMPWAPVARGICRNHIQPRMGHLPMRAVAKEHLEDFVAYLDALMRKAEIRWKTASNIWGTCSKMFDDATRGKRRELRILDTNPTRDVAPPEQGEETLKQYLYPDEFLLTVGSKAVPIERARLYTVAIYTMSRAGEIAPFGWDDVDLDHSVLHFHQAVDRVRNPQVVKSTKGKRARRVPIEAALLPLLLVMKEEGASLVIPSMPPPTGAEGLANVLRADLQRAGVTREELFKSTRTRKAITFHDLRATGITWSAIRGDDPLKIQQRAGHRTFATTQGYIREAEVLREGFGKVFPELPERLVGNRPGIVQSSPTGAISTGKMMAQTGAPRVPDDWPNAGNDGEVAPNAPPNRPVGADPMGRVAEHLARALELAAQAREWEVVATLSRQLEAIRLERAGVAGRLRVISDDRERGAQ